MFGPDGVVAESLERTVGHGVVPIQLVANLNASTRNRLRPFPPSPRHQLFHLIKPVSGHFELLLNRDHDLINRGNSLAREASARAILEERRPAFGNECRSRILTAESAIEDRDSCGWTVPHWLLVCASEFDSSLIKRSPTGTGAEAPCVDFSVDGGRPLLPLTLNTNSVSEVWPARATDGVVWRVLPRKAHAQPVWSLPAEVPCAVEIGDLVRE